MSLLKRIENEERRKQGLPPIKEETETATEGQNLSAFPEYNPNTGVIKPGRGQQQPQQGKKKDPVIEFFEENEAYFK